MIKRYDPKWKEKNYEKDPLAKITNEAREHNMSYGQYQAYLLAKSIKRDNNNKQETTSQT